uniref:Uncharacterized protein n=1 Tax=Romanomermis culicivorax TaxID=13658 RepID=A0A915IUH8_ROMCU
MVNEENNEADQINLSDGETKQRDENSTKNLVALNQQYRFKHFAQWVCQSPTGDQSCGYCYLCSKVIDISSMGRQALTSHQWVCSIELLNSMVLMTIELLCYRAPNSAFAPQTRSFLTPRRQLIFLGQLNQNRIGLNRCQQYVAFEQIFGQWDAEVWVPDTDRCNFTDNERASTAATEL